MPFLRSLAKSEVQIVSSRIWTRVTDTISDEDNRYAKWTFWVFVFADFFCLFSKEENITLR